MSKIFPVLILVASSYFLFEDKVKDFNLDFLNRDNKPSVVVSIQREVSDDMKTKVGGLVKIIQDSKATQEQKKYAASLWFANGDVWSQAKVSINSDKLPEYNKELLSVFSLQYPELSGLFPGFGQEVDKLFSDIIGEYPVPMDSEKTKQVSQLSYAIGWAFTQ